MQRTSHLPFFQWLPDELAFQYSRFSTRENFGKIYPERTPASFRHFLRRGRGVSFHDFELAIEPASGLCIAGSLSAFLDQNRLRTPLAEHVAFKNFLHHQSPAVPMPFFEKDLDLVMGTVQP